MAQTRLLAFAACAVVAAPALAAPLQDSTKPQPVVKDPLPPAAPPVIVVAPVRPRSGIAVSAGAGISHLSQGFFRDVTRIGAQGEARLTFGTRAPISFEVGYVGTVREFETLRPDEALLMSNGFEGALRLNFGMNEIQPYGFGGVGWHLFRVVNPHRITVSDFTDGDATISLPVGGGITGFLATGFLIDVRFAYRFAFDEDLLHGGIHDSRFAGLDSWSMTVQLGYEF